jgi:cell division protein FtsQ
LLLLALLAGAIWQFAYWEPRLLPVRVIEVQGDLHHHSSELLRMTISERLTAGILTTDLWDIKQAAEDLAWVGAASVRRVWPDRLQVRVEEHKPIARWNGDGLVTAQGLVFHPQSGTIPAGLPTLEGGEDRAPAVAARYLEWRDRLMLVGHLVQTLSVDARGAWTLDLVSGPRLELGSTHIEERLQRFINSIGQLEAAGPPKVVDLRYAKGFAVRWEQRAQAPTQTDKTARPRKRG